MPDVTTFPLHAYPLWSPTRHATSRVALILKAPDNEQKNKKTDHKNELLNNSLVVITSQLNHCVYLPLGGGDYFDIRGIAITLTHVLGVHPHASRVDAPGQNHLARCKRGGKLR